MSQEKEVIIQESKEFDYHKVEESKDGNYILEGVFGEIGKRNRNNRIYSEEEYLPQIEKLKPYCGTKLLGELDHPDTLDVKYKDVSHVVESLDYNKESGEIRGRIRLLDTDQGRNAKALVDGGVKLNISSRASGVVESGGNVKLKKLVTYDLVSDPGFQNAEMKSINESLGIEDDNVQIYELNDDKEDPKNTEDPEINNKNNQDNMSDNYITEDKFEEYTSTIQKEFDNLKEKYEELKNEKEKGSSEGEVPEDLKNWIGDIAKTVNELYSDLQLVQTEVDGVKRFGNYLSEHLTGVKNYAESNNKTIESVKEYANNLNESIYKVKEYSNKVNEDLKTVKDYAEQVSEDSKERSKYQDYIVENIIDPLIGYAENNNENVENVKNYAERVMENVKKVHEGRVDEDESSEKEGKETDLFEGMTKETKDIKKDDGEKSNDEWKEELSGQLTELISSAKQQKVEENAKDNFLNFVSESYRRQYSELDSDSKEKLIESFRNNEFNNTVEADRIWENAIKEISKPHWLNDAPNHYQEKFQKLDEKKQNELRMQANIAKLDTEQDIKEWWDSRKLGDSDAEYIDESKNGNGEKTEDPRINEMRKSMRKLNL